MSNPKWIRLSHHDGVSHLNFDRPPVNAFDPDFLSEVLESVESLGRDTRALVVSSRVDGLFAAGGDIPWMANAPLEEQLEFVRLCQDAYRSFEQSTFPTIAAIEGPCLGGGLELALACDIRVAGPGASLGLPESQIGLIAGGGAINRIVRAVGQGIARDMLITGRRLSGTEAGLMGVVSRVASEDGVALVEAGVIAREIAEGPTEAIEASKRIALAAPDLGMDEGLKVELEAWAEVRQSLKSQEALDAFAEKRPPDFAAAQLRVEQD